MLFDSFSTLKTALIDYSQRSGDVEVSLNMNNFIGLGQLRVCRSFDDLTMNEKITIPLIEGEAQVEKTINWITTDTLFISEEGKPSEQFPIYRRGYDVLMYIFSGSGLGKPSFYADYSSTQWILRPIPDRRYSLYINQISIPPLLSDVQQTNIILQKLPDALFYACLYEIYIYLDNREKLEERLAKLSDRAGTS